MKRMKSGFTLAEVLITLGIIGVVAAIVMPAVMTNYTYKTVGVKLSKFMSQLEGATRPYVVQNASFTNGADSELGIGTFVEESFLIKNKDKFESGTVDCDGADLTEAQTAACAGVPADGEGKKGSVEYTTYAQSAYEAFTATEEEGAKLPDDVTAVQIKDVTRFNKM